MLRTNEDMMQRGIEDMGTNLDAIVELATNQVATANVLKEQIRGLQVASFRAGRFGLREQLREAMRNGGQTESAIVSDLLREVGEWWVAREHQEGAKDRAALGVE